MNCDKRELCYLAQSLNLSLNSMNCDKRELCYLAQTLCLLREVRSGCH